MNKFLNYIFIVHLKINILVCKVEVLEFLLSLHKNTQLKMQEIGKKKEKEKRNLP
jgi:hypothetical protein